MDRQIEKIEKDKWIHRLREVERQIDEEREREKKKKEKRVTGKSKASTSIKERNKKKRYDRVTAMKKKKNVQRAETQVEKVRESERK